MSTSNINGLKQSNDPHPISVWCKTAGVAIASSIVTDVALTSYWPGAYTIARVTADLGVGYVTSKISYACFKPSLNLNDWIKKEGGQSAEAAQRISECFENKSSSLNLANLKLKTLPDCFYRLPALKKLDLSNNCFNALPDTIRQLRHLKELNLSMNEKLTNLPDWIAEQTDLEWLSLDNATNLANLPQNIDKLVHLQYLHLNNTTKLKSFPDAILQLPKDCVVNLDTKILYQYTIEWLEENSSEGPQFVFWSPDGKERKVLGNGGSFCNIL